MKKILIAITSLSIILALFTIGLSKRNPKVKGVKACKKECMKKHKNKPTSDNPCYSGFIKDFIRNVKKSDDNSIKEYSEKKLKFLCPKVLSKIIGSDEGKMPGKADGQREKSEGEIIFDECQKECAIINADSISEAKCDGAAISAYIRKYAETRGSLWYESLSKICPQSASKLASMK